MNLRGKRITAHALLILAPNLSTRRWFALACVKNLKLFCEYFLLHGFDQIQVSIDTVELPVLHLQLLKLSDLCSGQGHYGVNG